MITSIQPTIRAMLVSVLCVFSCMNAVPANPSSFAAQLNQSATDITYLQIRSASQAPLPSKAPLLAGDSTPELNFNAAQLREFNKQNPRRLLLRRQFEAPLAITGRAGLA